jgi:hypothetical protein
MHRSFRVGCWLVVVWRLSGATPILQLNYGPSPKPFAQSPTFGGPDCPRLVEHERERVR